MVAPHAISKQCPLCSLAAFINTASLTVINNGETQTTSSAASVKTQKVEAAHFAACAPTHRATCHKPGGPQGDKAFLNRIHQVPAVAGQPKTYR